MIGIFSEPNKFTHSSKYPIGIQHYSFNLDSRNETKSNLFKNEAIYSGSPKKPIRTISWLKTKTREDSLTGLRMDSSIRRNYTPVKRHFIPSPYGIILKGKKLKQRHDIGGIFRENFDTNFKLATTRNELNMRTKWK